MSDNADEPEAPPDDARVSRAWEAAEVMRLRAEKARAERDESIAQLRDGMTDDDILADFGVDLDELEK